MTTGYLDTLIQTDKYKSERQLLLKERVFTTFVALMRHFGLPGILPTQSLLDLGTADGALVAIAKKHGVTASGLDVTDGINFETDCLPFPDASLDIVTAVSLIEHIQAPALLLSEVRRVLRPNGALILVTPNWRFSYRAFYDDPTHVRPYTEKSMKFLLRSAGFKQAHVVPWLVCKPSWMWSIPYAFEVARMIPFRWSPTSRLPNFLLGQSKSLLAIAIKDAGEMK